MHALKLLPRIVVRIFASIKVEVRISIVRR